MHRWRLRPPLHENAPLNMSDHDQPDETTPADDSASEPMRYRLVVASAAEAVALVRERFGAAARVISVRQLEAGGLKRFLQKPRLEVIVEVGVAATPPESRSSRGHEAEAESQDSGIRGQESGISGQRETPAGALTPDSCLLTPISAPRRELSLLRATGFDEALVARIRAEHPALDWNALAAPEALSVVGAWLRRSYDTIPRRPAGNRRVFLGSCGAGKTTALCKALALDVFVRGQPVAVLKLDGDQPNASDGLAAFCDVLGAPLLRSAAEVEEFDAQTLLYVDVPGVGLDAHAEHARLAQTLDALRVDMRVLVVNAACEAEAIQDMWEVGRVCGATHVVFTHGDEVRRPGKLWRFVLNGGLRPLFMSAGPSPAGEVEEDVFSALLARTFPSALARAVAPSGTRS
jgi:flagellar biosynthesis protein FlhF